MINTLRLIAACGLLTLVGCDRADPIENATRLPPELEGPVEPPKIAQPELPDNAQSTAVVGLVYYKDLPQAVGLRGVWQVTDAAWFAVRGRSTEAQSKASLAAMKGAVFALKRDEAAFSGAKEQKLPIVKRCQALSFLDKDRLVAANRSTDSYWTTRENVLLDLGIAVAEKDLLERFNRSLSSAEHTEIIAVACDDPDNDPENGIIGAPALTGVYQIDANQTVFLFENGVAALAERQAQ